MTENWKAYRDSLRSVQNRSKRCEDCTGVLIRFRKNMEGCDLFWHRTGIFLNPVFFFNSEEIVQGFLAKYNLIHEGEGVRLLRNDSGTGTRAVLTGRSTTVPSLHSKYDTRPLNHIEKDTMPLKIQDVPCSSIDRWTHVKFLSIHFKGELLLRSVQIKLNTLQEDVVHILQSFIKNL